VADPKTYTEDEFNAMVAERDALKGNRDEILKEAKKAKDALKNYDGIDPAEYKTLKSAAEEAERKRAASEGDFKSIEAQLKALHQKELETVNTKLGKTQKALERRLVQAELTKAIAARKGEPDLLLPYAEKFVKVKETDDDYEAYIVDAGGNPRFADGKGTPMDFGAFVEQELMVKYPRAFDGTGSSGGGATKSNPGGGGAKVVAAGDSKAFMDNLEGIASGKVQVR
jgi:hypothetical protein